MSNFVALENFKSPEHVDYIDPPIIGIVAERGEGKTVLATALGYAYWKYDNMNVWTNYHISGYPSRFYTFEELADFPEDLKNAVVLMDEGHVGADSYNSLTGRVKGITDLITQIRKRNVTFIYTTQRYNTIAKRLRLMTNYLIQPEKDRENEGDYNCFVFDRQLPKGADFIKMFVLKGKLFYNMYDTKEIISL